MKSREEKRTVLSKKRRTVLRKIQHHVEADEGHVKSHNGSFTEITGCEDSHEDAHLRKDDQHKLMKYLQKDIRHRNLECIEETLVSSASKFQLADIDPNGTLLMYAFSLHFLDVIELLLKYNSPIGCNESCGLSVLHQAVKYQRMDILQVLLRYQVDVNQPSLYEQKTALHIAVKHNNIQLVLLLLSYGANPDKTDIYGCTPLHRAASYGLNEMVSLLLEHHADINAVDRVTWTPLHHSAEMNYWKTVKLLIDRKANITAQTKYGKSALHLACHRGHYKVAKVLLDKGCPAGLKDIHGNTALTYADEPNIISLLDSFDNNTHDHEAQPEPIKHISMHLRSKLLVDLLDTDYLKHNYYTSVADKTEAKCKSMPGLNSGKLQKRRRMGKTISKSFTRLLGRSTRRKIKDTSTKNPAPEAQNTYNTMSFIDAYEISTINEESLHKITPRDAKKRPSPTMNTPNSDWGSTPLKRQKSLRFQFNADRYTPNEIPPSSTPRDSKPQHCTPNFIHLHHLLPPSSTPRNSKPKQPQFTNDATGLTSNYSDLNISTVHSISDMEISAVASTCQYSNTHLSDPTASQEAVTTSNCNSIELTNQIVDEMQKNSALFKKLRNDINECLDTESVKEASDLVDNYISSVAKATDECISSITEITYALKIIKDSCDNEQKLKRLKELTSFLDQWALNTVDFKVNFKNNYILEEDMGLS